MRYPHLGETKLLKAALTLHSKNKITENHLAKHNILNCV